MRYFLIFSLIFLIQNCSFDKKSGIWKNEKTFTKNSNNVFKDFKSINITNESFQKIVPIKNDFKFKEINTVDNYSWKDTYYNQSNNFSNFSFNENYNLTFTSKKITKYEVNKNLLFENDNVIITDRRGNIMIFSINKNNFISKFNFYKKNYKKISKKLNIIVENSIVYVFDNLGYFYAFSYEENKILWAQKHSVGFRSNIKIYKKKLIASDQNNQLYFINKNNGEKLIEIPTEETTINNNFKNNLSLKNNLLFYINTFGSLYAIDIENMRVVWFTNFNQSLNLNPRSIFVGNQIINDDDKIVISSNNYTYVIDQTSGSTFYKKNFATNLRPIILDKYLFIITKEKFLIATNISTGNIIYSYDLNSKVSEFLNIKKDQLTIKNFMILESKIVVFLENSYILIFNINGNLEQIKKLPAKINSFPIAINKSILYIDKKNRISILD